MIVSDKKTGRKFDIGNCYHIDIMGNSRLCKVKGKCTDKDRPWFGQYMITYSDGEETYAEGHDLFMNFEDVLDQYFNRKKKRD